MATSCHAELTGFGVLCSGLGEREIAERIRDLFSDSGFPAIVTPFAADGDFRVLVIGATLEEYRRVADGTGIKLL